MYLSFSQKGRLLSQQTRNPARLREWREYVRGEAAKLWGAQDRQEGTLKLTVVYYHERQSVLIDHDNMIKPIQDALTRLVYRNDRQITDAQTRKTNIDGLFRLRYLSAVYARAFAGGKHCLYQNRRSPKSPGTAVKPSILNESERSRLERIASDYLTQGYEVKVRPRPSDLPEFLAGFKPDLIVSGKGESIVVEVKTRGELASAPFDSALEAASEVVPVGVPSSSSMVQPRKLGRP
jgi:Holliday junction resolvase RusA-like endonuclease